MQGTSMPTYVALHSPDPFVRVRRAAARDAELSLGAKGLLLFMLSHADGFTLDERRLVESSRDGRDAVRAGDSRSAELT